MKYQRRRRRTHPRTRPEDRLLPLLYPFDDPAPQRSCPTVDEVLTKAQFLSPLLYQIHCIGPVGFGFAHIYSEGPLKTRPYNWCRLWEIASATMKCDGLLRQGQTPRGNDDGQPTRPQMENCQEVPSSTGVWRHVRGLRPHQGPDDPQTSRVAPGRPRQRKTAAARNTFKGLRGENSS